MNGKTRLQSVKTGQSAELKLLGELMLLKSENSKLMKSIGKPGTWCANKLDQKDDLVILHEFFSGGYIICFWTTCHNFCFLLH